MHLLKIKHSDQAIASGCGILSAGCFCIKRSHNFSIWTYVYLLRNKWRCRMRPVLRFVCIMQLEVLSRRSTVKRNILLIRISPEIFETLAQSTRSCKLIFKGLFLLYESQVWDEDKLLLPADLKEEPAQHLPSPSGNMWLWEWKISDCSR